MIEGRRDQVWARWMRPWTVVAWAFLACGIALGSWWAYYELGWGGLWFWDPVENASFMPWLVGTALIHSLAVTEKRGLFKSWTLLLAVLAFSLSLIGTFLVRSGVLVSVHSFAADPTRGIFILRFLVRDDRRRARPLRLARAAAESNAGFELLARESFLLFNNILLVIAAAVVFAGTHGAADLGDTRARHALGRPAVFQPHVPVPVLPLLALLSLGMHARWRRGKLREARSPLADSVRRGVVIGCALVFGLLPAAACSPRWALRSARGSFSLR